VISATSRGKSPGAAFITADHDGRNRADVLEQALEQLTR
jgi:hypothetical protein